MKKPDPLLTVAIAAFTAFTASCGDEDATPTPSDADLDGFTVEQGDCDDHNNTVYPGAREYGLDGVDSNCDDDELPAAGEDRYDDALPVLDTDGDDAISLDEFEAACAEAAMVFGDANPGIVETHASCAGTSSCRGMILHPWNDLYEHDCRGVNGCAGWSCVETADDRGRDGATAYSEAHCDYCHSGSGGAFALPVAAGADPDAALAAFEGRSEDWLRGAIAFGIRGVTDDGVAYANMPPHYALLSRAEMDAVIAYLRSLPVEVHAADE